MKPVVQRRLEILRAVRFWRPSSWFDRSLHSWQDKELRFPNKETHILASQKGMLSCVTRRQASKDEKNLPPSMARKNTQTRIMETHITNTRRRSLPSSETWWRRTLEVISPQHHPVFPMCRWGPTRTANIQTSQSVHVQPGDMHFRPAVRYASWFKSSLHSCSTRRHTHKPCTHIYIYIYWVNLVLCGHVRSGGQSSVEQGRAAQGPICIYIYMYII